jgi:aspartate aminotransferase
MTKPTPSNVIQHVPRSGIRRVFDEAAKYPDCIRLEVGEPSFSTPAHIKEAAVKALAENFTKYTANAGIPELRSAIVDKLRVRNGISVDSNDVVVTSGGVAACFTALAAMVNPGDEVLLADPSWPNYVQMTVLLGVKAVHYRLRLENNLIPTVEDIERCITPLPRLREILELAHRHNLWVISDEVYDEIWFDTSPHSLQPLDTQERVVSVFSFSKTYAMTGWRVGYLTGASEIVSHVLRAQEPTTSCVNSTAQRGAVAALLGDQQCVAEMRSAYASRAKLVTKILDDHGVPYARPTGAFYTMVDISGARMSDLDFVSRMITERRVAVVPGSAFGPASGNVVRVSLASSESDLQSGVERLASAISDWSN